MKKILNKYNAIALAVLMLFGCSEDFLEPTVSTSKDVNTSINTVEDLDGIMLGAYDRMGQIGYYGRDIIAHGTVRSDNAYSNGNSGRFVLSGQFAYNSTSGDPSTTWLDIYEVIANTNLIIDAEIGDEGSTPEAQHIVGEAYAVRALAHMDLLRFYGQIYTGGSLGIPYVGGFLSDLAPSRNSIADTWTMIGNDLDMAESLMSESLNEGPIRMTTYGVAAIKTRYHLYTGNWSALISEAEYVINSGEFNLASGAGYASSFVGGLSDMSIFEIAFTPSDNPNINGLFNIYNRTNYGDVVATQDLYDAYEDGDVRKDLYGFDEDGTTIRMLGKYPTGGPTYDDNVLVIRYAEVILNYAEALLQSGQAGDALTELNKIPAAVGASTYGEATMDNILEERRKELAFEGFRFHDLLRNGRDIMKVDPRQTFDGDRVAFGDSDLAFPIPENEINANSNIEQNTGY